MTWKLWKVTSLDAKGRGWHKILGFSCHQLACMRTNVRSWYMYHDPKLWMYGKAFYLLVYICLGLFTCTKVGRERGKEEISHLHNFLYFRANIFFGFSTYNEQEILNLCESKRNIHVPILALSMLLTYSYKIKLFRVEMLHSCMALYDIHHMIQ